MAKIDSETLLSSLKQQQVALDSQFSLRKTQVESAEESLTFSDTVLVEALGVLQSGAEPQAAAEILVAARQKIRDRDKALTQSLSSLIAKYQAIEAVIGEVERLNAEEENVVRVAQRLEDGEIDESRPRRIGDRPETIKNVRAAKARLAEPDGDE